MAAHFQKSALDTVRVFRKKEITGLIKHLRKFGPLPDVPASVSAGAAVDAPAPFVLPNPFLPKKHPKMRKWVPPKYSLRRQAELVKQAQASGTMDLLPPGPKKFAAELRAERVKKSLSVAVLQQLTEVEKKANAVESIFATQAESEMAESERKVKDIEARIKELGSTLDGLKESLKTATAEYDLGELATFDAEADKTTTKAQLTEIINAQQKLGDTKEGIEQKVADTESLIEAAHNKLNSTAPSAKVEDLAWKTPVHWAGEFAKTKVPGSELGTRLYTGKKRMFKGHLWERQRAGRMRKHAILMRDMPARIARYKNYYKKRKPNPLKPSRYTKPPKLPY